MYPGNGKGLLGGLFYYPVKKSLKNIKCCHKKLVHDGEVRYSVYIETRDERK